MPHVAGKKVAKKHSTIIETAEPLIKFAVKHPLVDKVVTGEIVAIRNGPRRLKITIIPAGLQLMVRGVNSRQKLFIYTAQARLIEKELLRIWLENFNYA